MESIAAEDLQRQIDALNEAQGLAELRLVAARMQERQQRLQEWQARLAAVGYVGISLLKMGVLVYLLQPVVTAFAGWIGRH